MPYRHEEVGRFMKLVLPIFWTIVLLIVDVTVYGWAIPIVGTYIGGNIAVALHLSPFLEIVLVIFSVFTLLLWTFRVKLETRFMRHFFSQDDGFKLLLQTRDFLNFILIIYSLNSLFNAIKAIINDQEMKSQYLGEGLGYIVMKPFTDEALLEQNWLKSCACTLHLHNASPPAPVELVPEGIWVKIKTMFYSITYYIGFTEGPSVVTSVCKQCLIRDRFIHGAQFIFAIAGLTATVTKVIYFNTLYAFMRAMEIFMSMQEAEEDDEDDEEYSMDERPDTVKDEPTSRAPVPQRILPKYPNKASNRYS